MTLSFTIRLLCVLTVVSGFVLAASQVILAIAAHPVLRHLDSAGARRRERLLYLVQIGPALFAVFVAGAICLPAFLYGEANRGTERVSSLCLLVAALMLCWFGAGLFRGLRITFRTLRFARTCRRSARTLHSSNGMPVLAVQDPGPPLRLIGFFRPFILVSASFAQTSSDAFGLALAHEHSHAEHLDNWKLLTLAFLPRLDRLLPGGDPWSESWQRSADWAADDDAVGNDPGRSLLLAEALVAAARAVNSVPASRTPYICTALAVADTRLAARIERLLLPRRSSDSPRWSVLSAIAAVVVVGAATAFALFPWIYKLSEHLLHIGAA